MRRQSARLRGVRGAAVKAIGCGGVIAAISIMPVTAGQARANSGAGKSALAPVTFTSTGAEQTYTVPAEVTRLEVQAVGANGGNTKGPFKDQIIPGGTGGMVTGELSVGPDAAIKPGQTLYVEVGSAPMGTTGGFNGGGAGPPPPFHLGGNGGGGASDIRTCSRTSASCPNNAPSPLTRLIVAGGGGGAGGCDSNDDDDCPDLSGPGGSADHRRRRWHARRPRRCRRTSRTLVCCQAGRHRRHGRDWRGLAG
jgi:hypothetical protein